MRKLFLALTSCIALVAFMGFSATALANHVEGELHDPFCAGTYEPGGFGGGPTGWDYGFSVVDFQIDSPDSYVEDEASRIVGSGHVCGSVIGDGGVGAETLANHADISVPNGVEISDSALVEEGSYAGTAKVNILMQAGEGQIASFVDDVDSVVRAAPKLECQYEIDNQLVADAPDGRPHPEGSMVQCLRGSNPLGYNYTWTTLDDTGQMAFTIGPMHNDELGIDPGLTYLNLTLCDFYGGPRSFDRTCGTEVNGDQWVQKNGRSPDRYAETGCPADRDNGVYSITVTNEGSETTYPADTTPVPWTIASRISPKNNLAQFRCTSPARPGL